MKQKHIEARIKHCLALADCSPCPRRKFGAVLVDPERNQILAEGYNGGPRGNNQGNLCGGNFCKRDGFKESDFKVLNARFQWAHMACTVIADGIQIIHQRQTVWEKAHMATAIDLGYTEGWYHLPQTTKESVYEATAAAANTWISDQCRLHPPVASGTHAEIGCHHAEMNLICNAAASTISTRGAWLFISGEPCLMCSKLIAQCGIQKVFIVKGGFAGPNGVDYLRTNSVKVEYVQGPPDPRGLQ